MHLGGMAVIGNRQPMNFCHILLNNGAHESVGGMPTIAYQVNWQDTAKAFGYKYAVRILKEEELVRVLEDVNRGMEGPLFIEILANISSREDLMRPTIKPIDNKKDFMNFIGEA
jgi:phosphonopyruvate decarboxylase